MHRQPDTDTEKGSPEDDAFNLRDYLTSANAAQDDAGLTNHHKRVGVAWKDLEVIVPGGVDFKVGNSAPSRPAALTSSPRFTSRPLAVRLA